MRRDLEEVTARRKRLMARQYIEHTKQLEVDLEKANKDLQKVDKRLADSIDISTEISGMLARKKEALRKLEIACMDEGIELYEGKLKKEREGYYAAQAEVKAHQVEATRHKRQIGIFLRRKAELEKT